MLVSWEWYIYPPKMTANPPQIPQISEDHINHPKKSSFQNHPKSPHNIKNRNLPLQTPAERRLKSPAAAAQRWAFEQLPGGTGQEKRRETPGLLGDLTPIMISCRTFWLLNQTHVALVKGISQRVQKLGLLKNMLDYFSDLLRPKTAKV